MLKISENIAVLRKQKGITQEELAKKLNISNQAVSKWESGKCCPDIEILPELASFFGVSIDILLLGECSVDTKVSLNPKDPLILRAIEIARTKEYISTSVLQKFMNIGYDTAKRIIADMCNCGYLKKDKTATFDKYLYIGNIENA